MLIFFHSQMLALQFTVFWGFFSLLIIVELGLITTPMLHINSHTPFRILFPTLEMRFIHSSIHRNGKMSQSYKIQTI